jgi:hypothetical protein
LYWIWRHYRGNRLVTTGNDATVKVLGGWNGKTGVAMVFNDQDKAQEVEVFFQGIPEHTQANVRWECLYLDKEAKKMVRGNGSGDTFAAQPYSTYAVLVDLPEDIRPKNVSERLEFFGKSVMNEFMVDEVSPTITVNIDVPAEALKDAKSVRGRVGLLGNALEDRILMTLGKETYPLESGTYFQEVPVRKFPGAGINTLGFKLAKSDGKHRIIVSCATLVIER